MSRSSPGWKTRGRVYTTGMVAKICDVAMRTASKWIDSGHLPGHRLPGSNDRRVYRSDLIEFLRKHKIKLPAELKDSCVLVAGPKEFAARFKDVVCCDNDFELGALIGAREHRWACAVVQLGGWFGNGVADRAAKILSEAGVSVVGVLPEDRPTNGAYPKYFTAVVVGWAGVAAAVDKIIEERSRT